MICLFLCLVMLMTFAGCSQEEAVKDKAPSGNQGQLGDSEDNVTEPVTEPVQKGEASFSLSGQHTTYLDEDGNLYVWGSNIQYQLGYGGTKEKPTPYCILTDVAKVCAMPFITAALKTNGDLYIMGMNSLGQAGGGDQKNVSEPTLLLSNIKDFAHNGNNGAAITEDGSLYVWGSDGFTKTPEKVLDNAQTLHVGDHAMGVITDDGTLYVWTSTGAPNAADASEISMENYRILENVEKIYIPYEDDTVAALTVDGSVYTWGSELTGMLGYESGSELSCCPTPTKVLDNVDKLWFGAWPYGGNSAVAAICTDGSIYTWGYNTDGQVGNGTDDHQVEPYLLELA